jgi:hypothetical protein
MKTKSNTLLKCRLTGETRRSNEKYISTKAETNNTTPEDWASYYVAKSSLLAVQAELVEAGIKPVLAQYDVDGETLDKILRYNGKSKKTLSSYKKQSPQQVQVTKKVTEDEPVTEEVATEEVA